MTIQQVCEKYHLTQGTLRYYERVGMIPPVTRTAGGIRDYQESDLQWVKLAQCMRSAGLSVGTLVSYVKLVQEGDGTIPERLRLLEEQMAELLRRREQIDETIDRLRHKIDLYQEKMKEQL